MQLKSKQAITRLRTMKTKVIGFEDTIECGVEAITSLEQQLTDKEKQIARMTSDFSELVNKFNAAENRIAELEEQLSTK